MDWIVEELGQMGAATAAFFAFDTARIFEPAVLAALAFQVLLFCCSAFFSGSETALFSLSRLDLQKLRRDRHPQSETLHALLDQPRRLIISLLCGNELVNIAATANLAGILVYLYGEDRAGWINVLIMFPLLLLLGEVTPKTIAVSDPMRISAGMVAAPLSIWVRVITPIRRAVRVVADLITTWIVGEERGRENILQIDEFRTLVEDVADEGILDATERVLIDNLLEAGETEIVEIMTPRTRTRFLKDDMSVPEMLEAFREIKHPRVPVCRDHPDNLVGFLHAEDMVRLVFEGAKLDKLKPSDILHPPVVAPPTKHVDEMFDFFQANNARAAVVLNEFGGVEGFITMRDVVNFIFGEISESISGQELYQERDENVYEVAGQMKLTDFNDLTNFGIEDPRMTTIGGVVFRYLDRLPKVGDRVVMDGIVATVLEMDGHRLAKVRVSKGRLDEDLEEEPDARANVDQALPAAFVVDAASGPEAAEPESVEVEPPNLPAEPEIVDETDEKQTDSAEVVDLAVLKHGKTRRGKKARRASVASDELQDEERT